ncbi:MAG: chromosome segregation protein SMC [Desulfuromonadales bacterium]|nr:chromosome segregation protein SMC [Desulfuromonadales bacterium]
MKIRRVDIVGFKSFVDKTTFEFNDGITAVVGPNGCGKSNIVDAIRWTMGEQNAKNLRGKLMEDVIFGGSESRKPLGMAEVRMTFDNTDGNGPPAFNEYAEISVTRRLHRNGDSDYLLNNTPCRLLDITELFMDTGGGARSYSIIEQGKIGMILNAKPEERRVLIEEAAGVVKFKNRKKAALRKIEATRQNLLRLSDIISEVRRQLNSLNRQAKKAERYRTLREELKGIETRFALEKFLELRQACAAALSNEGMQQAEHERLSAQLLQHELELENLRLTQTEQEKTLSAVQEKLFALTAEIQNDENRIEFSGKEADSLALRGERLLAEANDCDRRLGELEVEAQTLTAGREDLGERLVTETRRLEEATHNAAVLEEQEAALSARLDQARTDLYAMLNELSRLGAQQEAAQKQLLSLDDREARNRHEAVAVRERWEAASAELASLDAGLHEMRTRRGELQRERDELHELMRQLRLSSDENEAELLLKREEYNRYHSRLESLRQLEKSLEGYGAGVKSLLRDTELNRRFDGVAADALEVPARYEAAVEAVLGERLQALVTQEVAAATEALDYLRRKEGRCTFLLPGFKSGRSVFAAGTPLSELVKPRDATATQVENLLADIYLVADLQPYLTAQQLPDGVILVTEAGDVLTCAGALSGGGKQALQQGVLHRKREMKELAAQVTRLVAEVEKLQSERQGLRNELKVAEERQGEIDAGLRHKERKVVDNERELARLQSEVARFQERVEVLQLEEGQLHEEREELVRRQQAAGTGRLEQERDKLLREEAVAALQSELQGLRGAIEQTREQVTTARVAVAGLREREEAEKQGVTRLRQMREELRGRKVLLLSQAEEGREERARLQQEQQRLRAELEQRFNLRRAEKAAYDAQRDAFELAARAIESCESRLKELRTQVNATRESLAALQLRLREQEIEAEHLRQAILERYRIDLAEAALPVTEFNSDLAAGRMDVLRRQIELLGEVNLTAIEEYRELEERSGFLTEQQDDLRQSMDGLQQAIGKINRTTRKRFKEAFAQVNENFKDVFPRLFRGGRAELVLTDENDLLETGIEIVAQPPGKKLQSVGLLSGGEKALTAVALIFSIFLIKPSPFCMLDEVDAPLDDANIGRFNEMVREMSTLSQFIIITHNKRTMEIADTLYGVTMEEPGVSKLVSVQINALAS